MKALIRCLAWLAAGASYGQQTFQAVDVQAVRAEGAPAQWVRSVTVSGAAPEIACDILVAGGGMGGVAAALRAAQRGHNVCLTESTDWLGGQATAGGVSALDENRFIEFSGGTRTYYEFRRRIRDHYRDAYTLAPEAAALTDFNPGSCYVSPLCFEPNAGVRALDEMLAPHRERIRVLLRTEIVHLDVAGGRIRSALALDLERSRVTRIRPQFVLDATELGDLLPLAGVPYVVGSEARSDTGEPHAGEAANAACVQSFTYPFAIEHTPGETHRITKPPEYEKFRDTQQFSFRLYYPVDLGWKGYVQ